MVTTSGGECQKQSGSQQHLYSKVDSADHVDHVGQPPMDSTDEEAGRVSTTRTAEVMPLVDATINIQLRGAVGGEQPPPEYCFLSWFACLCCCWPIGIYAIFMSMSVSSRMEMNDFEGACQASKTAREASVVSIIAGIIFHTFYFIAMNESNVYN